MRSYATVEVEAFHDGVTLVVDPPELRLSEGDSVNFIAHISDKDVKLVAKLIRINTSTAANDLYSALKACETGVNDFGPYWNTKALVQALRTFYGAMEGT